MARQRSKLSRRSIRLAEGLLLPGLLVSAAHAAGSVPQAAAMAPVLIADAGDVRLAGPRGSDVYLDLTLNGMPRGLVQLGLRDGELWASAAALRQLGFVLRYSVPIFVQPAGALPSAPQLAWGLRRDGDKAVLEVANSGASHAQLADISFTDSAGVRTAVHPGLLGYVLPGAQMRWALKVPATAFGGGGTWETMTNGTTAQQVIPTVDSPR